MPGTLVLKTMAIYVEYLRGYTQDGDGPEHADDDDEQAALLAAFALG